MGGCKKYFINILKKKSVQTRFGHKNKRKKDWVYFLKIARITLMIDPTTTTQPATTVIISGMPGIVKVESIIPDPTASATITPTTHAKIPTIVLSAMFTSLFLFSPCREMEKNHCHHERDYNCEDE